MKYTKNDIYNAIRVFEDEAVGEIDDNCEAIALACLREAYRNMQDTFEIGDVLCLLRDTELPKNHGIFVGYSNDQKTAVNVLTMNRYHVYGSSCWEVVGVNKVGRIDMTDFVRAIDGKVDEDGMDKTCG